MRIPDDRIHAETFGSSTLMRDAEVSVPAALQAPIDRVQHLIRRGQEEGATLVLGGNGKPIGIEKGYFVRQTVFAEVTNDMGITRDEIFGPMLSIPTKDSEEVIVIANATVYSISGSDSNRKLAANPRIKPQLGDGIDKTSLTQQGRMWPLLNEAMTLKQYMAIKMAIKTYIVV